MGNRSLRLSEVLYIRVFVTSRMDFKLWSGHKNVTDGHTDGSGISHLGRVETIHLPSDAFTRIKWTSKKLFYLAMAHKSTINVFDKKEKTCIL